MPRSIDSTLAVRFIEIAHVSINGREKKKGRGSRVQSAECRVKPLPDTRGQQHLDGLLRAVAALETVVGLCVCVVMGVEISSSV